ncbi:MAG: hypothetical protein RJA36_1340 [Pseudomonadota bacterium]
MNRILLAVDGSDCALRAVARLIERAPPAVELELHLLNVQLPVDGLVRSFVSADELQAFHHAEAEAALAAARARLAAAGMPFRQHVLVGHPAREICRLAAELGCDEIVMGSHGRTGLVRLLLGSVAAEVREQASVPVTLVE